MIWEIYDFKNHNSDYFKNKYTRKIDFVNVNQEKYIIKITQEHLDKIAKNFSDFLIKDIIKIVFKREIKSDITIKFSLEEITNRL